MSEENTSPTEVAPEDAPETTEASSADPSTEEAVPPPAGPPPPQWEYRKNFKVTERMKEVVNLSIEVSKMEIARIRKKINKLTYGS